MLAQARARFPELHLTQADLLHELPAELEQPFDRVVSAYVLHEFDLDAKIALLQRIAARQLAPGGCILIADIAFPTALARQKAAERWGDAWDEEEEYWAADEGLAACERAGFQVTYRQISSCAGIFTLTLAGATTGDVLDRHSGETIGNPSNQESD